MVLLVPIRFIPNHSRVSHIRNHFLSVRSKPVSYNEVSIKGVFHLLIRRTVLSFWAELICTIDVYKDAISLVSH